MAATDLARASESSKFDGKAMVRIGSESVYPSTRTAPGSLSSAAAIFVAIGANESLTLAPPDGNSTTLPMRMKIVVAD